MRLGTGSNKFILFIEFTDPLNTSIKLTYSFGRSTSSQVSFHSSTYFKSLSTSINSTENRPRSLAICMSCHASYNRPAQSVRLTLSKLFMLSRRSWSLSLISNWMGDSLASFNRIWIFLMKAGISLLQSSIYIKQRSCILYMYNYICITYYASWYSSMNASNSSEVTVLLSIWLTNSIAECSEIFSTTLVYWHIDERVLL